MAAAGFMPPTAPPSAMGVHVDVDFPLPRRRRARGAGRLASSSAMSSNVCLLFVAAALVAAGPSAFAFRVGSRVGGPLMMRNNRLQMKMATRSLGSTGSSAARSQTISLGPLGAKSLPFFASPASPNLSSSSSGSDGTDRKLSALRMAADKDDESTGGGKASSNAAARKTQSLTSPVRKTDRRSPTRMIAKPSANARSTMTLGGDKIVPKKADEKNVKASKSASDGGGFLGASYKFEDFKPPFADTSVKLANGLVNDGPFAWLVTYVDLFGYRPGKTLVGAIPQDATSSTILSPSEISERRAAAERDLTNISPEERQRRAELAELALKVAGAYAIFSGLVLDDGGFGGHLARFLVLLPLFAWRGYDLSAKSGL
mmetsp:Transcript_18615/g.53510  ORF Transcript_18615/g.53510 Transcript_18615/m.53510 type:complete len:373 (-) Transcript_18615:244-1362(-)